MRVAQRHPEGRAVRLCAEHSHTAAERNQPARDARAFQLLDQHGDRRPLGNAAQVQLHSGGQGYGRRPAGCRTGELQPVGSGQGQQGGQLVRAGQAVLLPAGLPEVGERGKRRVKRTAGGKRELLCLRQKRNRAGVEVAEPVRGLVQPPDVAARCVAGPQPVQLGQQLPAALQLLPGQLRIGGIQRNRDHRVHRIKGGGVFDRFSCAGGAGCSGQQHTEQQEDGQAAAAPAPLDAAVGTAFSRREGWFVCSSHGCRLLCRRGTERLSSSPVSPPESSAQSSRTGR